MYTGSGIYLPNEGPIDVGRVVELIHTPQGDGAVVVLHHQMGKDDALRRLREAAPEAVIQVRRYVEDWTRETPTDCADRFIEVMEHARPYTDHGTWGNEKNLAVESGGRVGAADGRLITWAEWQAIADYEYEVAARIRQQAPWIILHFPGLAYGHGEDWGYDRAHNIMPGFPVFPTQLGAQPDVAYNLLRPAIDLCHILNVHPYVQRGAPIMDEWQGLGRMQRVKALFPDKTLFAAETGDFDVQSPQAPDRILQIAYALQGDPAFLGYCFFILDSPDPAHNDNNWSRNRRIEAAYQRMTRTTRPRTWTQPGPTPATEEPPVIPAEPTPTPTQPPAPPAPTRTFLPGPVGRSWWVWYIDHCGGVDGIIEACKRTRANNVFLKGGDGPHVWDQVTTDVVNALTDAGLNVYLWHYTYLGWIDNTPHGDTWKWTFADEVTCVEEMLARGGPNVRGIISDNEAETEGRWREAEGYCAAVRAALPDRYFGHAPLPVIDYHQELPYVQYNAVCDGVQPQFYSRNLQGDPPWTQERIIEQWDRWSQTWRTAGLPVPPLMPSGEAYGLADRASIEEFESLAKQHEWPGWSYWSLEHALSNGLDDIVQAIADQDDVEVTWNVAKISLNAEDYSTVQAILANTWAGAEHINAILSKPEYGDDGRRTGYWAEMALKGNQDLLKIILNLP